MLPLGGAWLISSGIALCSLCRNGVGGVGGGSKKRIEGLRKDAFRNPPMQDDSMV